jgi:hypothetical protein
MKPLYQVISASLLGCILWGAVGCALLATASKGGPEHYPYHGPLMETNGVPVNPPRW